MGRRTKRDFDFTRIICAAVGVLEKVERKFLMTEINLLANIKLVT